MITIYTAQNIEELELDMNNEWHQLIQTWIKPIVVEGTQAYIANLDVEYYLLQRQDLIIPISINCKKKNSYVANLYNYLDYSRDEIAHEISNIYLQACLNGLVGLTDSILSITGFENVVCVNNWLVSTNVLPDVSQEEIGEITEFLLHAHPDHAIVWRSVNEYHHVEEQRRFVAEKYAKVTSRQICLVDTANYDNYTKTQKRHLKNDKKALKRSEYHAIQEYQEGISPTRIKELYDLLYIDKYSHNNPQYSLKFFELALDNHFFLPNFLMKGDQIDAFGFSFVLNNIISNPVIGYDTQKPKDLKLYRMLTYQLFDTARSKKYFSHRSSGVAGFKKLRGAKEYLEFFMIYTHHLSFRHKIGWGFFAFVINRIATPLIKSMKL